MCGFFLDRDSIPRGIPYVSIVNKRSVISEERSMGGLLVPSRLVTKQGNTCGIWWYISASGDNDWWTSGATGISEAMPVLNCL